MPPLGSREVDPHGAKLLWDWIAAMPRETPVVTEPVTSFMKEDLAQSAAAMRLAHAIAAGTIPEPDHGGAIAAGLASENPEIRALFERFRDPSLRPRTRRHDPAAILSLEGNPDKGAKLLSASGKLAACLACHRIGGAGLSFGPDLDGVGSRLAPGAILESLLEPSRTIAPEYFLWSVETRSGGNHTGFVISRDDDGLVLRTGPGLEQTFPAKEVRRTLAMPHQSAMPEGLADLLDAQEIADLLSFLAAAKSAD